MQVTCQLREAGYEAYWAGGCVRDQLLNHEPTDYDVATSARPEEIRKLFGKHRTLAIGASFGVITVLGPKAAGPIEVATFREDTTYSDGRRPDQVHYSTAREDAQRRDFTINGMFFDPSSEEVIDYVGGQADLDQGIIRAIGDPEERIEEDKLRMLRAVRFTATFDFKLDAATAAAVRSRANQLTVVSAERVGAEMRRMLVHKNRAHAVELLRQTGLLAVVLPQHPEPDSGGSWERTQTLLEALEKPSFSTALASLLLHHSNSDTVSAVNDLWRLTNKEVERTEWLLAQATALAGARRHYWPDVQRVLIHDGMSDLLVMIRAQTRLKLMDAGDLEFVEGRLAWPVERLNPPPLLTGDDLVRHGLAPSKTFRELLESVRNAQLEGEIGSLQEALSLVDRILDDRP